MTSKKIIRIALFAAVLFLLQIILNYLPNIEVVTFLFIIFSLHFSLDEVIYINIVFTTLEGVVYGFHTWTIMYYIIWSIYCIIVYVLKDKLNHWFKVALLSGFFGFMFGSLHSIPYFIIGGRKMGTAYIFSGLLFDLVHGVGNFIIATLLFDPINKVFNRRKNV